MGWLGRCTPPRGDVVVPRGTENRDAGFVRGIARTCAGRQDSASYSTCRWMHGVLRDLLWWCFSILCIGVLWSPSCGHVRVVLFLLRRLVAAIPHTSRSCPATTLAVPRPSHMQWCLAALSTARCGAWLETESPPRQGRRGDSQWSPSTLRRQSYPPTSETYFAVVAVGTHELQ